MLRNPVPNVLLYAIYTLDGLSELNRSLAIQMRIGLLHPLERCRLVASYRDRQFQDPLQQFRMPEPRLRFGCRALALDDSGQLAGSELVGVGMPRVQWDSFTNSVFGGRVWSVVGTTTPINTLVRARIISSAGAMSLSLVTMIAGSICL